MPARKRKSDAPVNVEVETEVETGMVTPEKSDELLNKYEIDDETNILAQVIAKRIMKETKKLKPSPRNTNYAEQCLQLKKVNHSLTKSFNVIEEEVKKLKRSITDNTEMIHIINDDIQWTTITDVSKKGRGIVVHYLDDDNIEYTTKLQEYNKMKHEEKIKHGSTQQYVLNSDVMSKMIEIYIDKNNTELSKETKILDALDVIVKDHKEYEKLFESDVDFYKKYNFNDEIEIVFEKEKDYEEEEEEEEEEEDEEEESDEESGDQ